MGLQKNASVGNRLYQMDYQTLANFATNASAAMLAAIATFATPVPALADIDAAVVTLQANINLWGGVGNRGSHADLVNLRASRNALRSLLEQEANYVENIARTSSPLFADQAAVILSAGMRVKDVSNSLPLYGPPQKARQLVRQALLGSGKIFLKWAKPLVLPGANSKPAFYIVQRGTPSPAPAFATIGSVTKTSFTDQSTSGQQFVYQVLAVSAAGISAPSDPALCIAQ